MPMTKLQEKARKKYVTVKDLIPVLSALYKKFDKVLEGLGIKNE